VTPSQSEIAARGETMSEPTTGASRGESHRDLASLARGWLLSLVGLVASGVFGLFFGIVIARGLGAAGAGVFFTAVAVFTIAAVGAQFGATTGLIRSIARFRALDQLDSIRPTLVAALLPVVLTGVLLGATLFVFAGDIAAAILDGDAAKTAEQYLRVFAPFLPVAVISSALLGATRGFGTLIPLVAVEHIGKGLLRPLLALTVLAAGLGSVALALAWAVPHALGLVGAIVALVLVVRRAASPRVRTYAPSAELTREFWRFTAPRGAAGVLQIALAWLDTILVAALASPHDAGIYKAAVSYINQGSFANQAIVFVIGPLLSGLLARDLHERAQSVYHTATWWLSALAWPIYLTFAVFAPLFMRVFGPEFEAGATALVILALPMLVAMAAGPVNVVLVMAGKGSWNLFNVAIALVTNVVLNVVLIPPFGISGAAVAWAATIIVLNVAALLEVGVFLKLRPLGSGFAIVACVSTACYGALGLVVRLTLGTTVPAFILFAALSTALYVLLIWRFREALHVRVLFESLSTRKRGGIGDAEVA
jgi:O-antigen/teichoic acid export membrane protein